MRIMYDEAREMLGKELNSQIAKGSLSKETFETIKKVVETLKDVETIKAMEERGYSNDSYDRYGRSYGYGESYDGGSYDHGSYGYSSRDGRRGRDADNDGKYSERGYRSYDNYSGHTNIEHLEEMLRNAKSEDEREKIRRWMREAQS